MQSKLKKFREARKLSVGEVSTLTGIKSQTYYKYESGARTPRRAVMVRLASVLGASVETLFFADVLDHKSSEKKGA